MKMPNKVTPYKESSIAKFPVILELLEKKNMTPSELFSKVRKNKIQSIDEFVEITLDAYDEETRKLVEENAVLQLSPGGNELFGWAWNKEKQDETEQA